MSLEHNTSFVDIAQGKSNDVQNGFDERRMDL